MRSPEEVDGTDRSALRRNSTVCSGSGQTRATDQKNSWLYLRDPPTPGHCWSTRKADTTNETSGAPQKVEVGGSAIRAAGKRVPLH